MKDLFLPIFAAAGPDVPPELEGGRAVGGSQLPGMHFSDLLLILIVSILIMTALLCWAIFIRKPKNEHARTRIYKSRSSETETEDGLIRKRKRHKRRRREHRSRNPTLSETGGLPPPRPEGPAGPQI